MTETNERLFAALRALSIEDRMVRGWFLAFTPTALALNRLRRVVIGVPARHGMSHFTSAAWPLWSAAP